MCKFKAQPKSCVRYLFNYDWTKNFQGQVFDNLKGLECRKNITRGSPYDMPEWQECITSYFKGEKQSLQEWDLRIGGYIFPTINENRILNVQLKLLDDYM